jgi:hypothetical protein
MELQFILTKLGVPWCQKCDIKLYAPHKCAFKEAK